MTQTILVADDDEQVLEFVELTLKLEGFELILARDGEQALKLASEEMPDLILLDIRMPGPVGFEILRRLRADSATETDSCTGTRRSNCWRGFCGEPWRTIKGVSSSGTSAVPTLR